ncbi:hypothetical protein CHLNCDRAFT_138177 [Chlorella variabilis]|uniref:Uncharacterized protein n=1 Tax=Chlorella variabilis TaxID=554065 RepID=E1Z3R1_CHLVA|nr:hypothetical protein CHLNCDRAFT_138177 [Chlorella variabilis]EFN59524.1 hypothetical protein CHLNCDRAFT_138177 [Chlorella variabilis]|eukprot:XP_005851626.1 hypothetical protein CHLNCDRAFT_138177 [Chlorella variabilis]
MARLMRFGSVPLGQHFGIFVASPFTQPAVVQAAMQFTKDDCVQPCPPHALAQGSSSSSSSAEASGVAAQQQLLGKMPLRLAFPEVPPAGVERIQSNDEAFEEQRQLAQQEGVTIRDKEHLRYYQCFRQQFPGGVVPGKPRHDLASDPCPACGWQLSSPEQTFCVTCGHYDAQLRSGSKQS